MASMQRAFTVLGLGIALLGGVRGASDFKGNTRPVLLIPGMASTQLRAWKHEECTGLKDIRVGDRLWLDVTQLLNNKDCWIRCMKLHPLNQSDVACRLRPEQNLDAIRELDPSIITMGQTSIWRDLIEALAVDFDYSPDDFLVAPYDWRLPPSELEKRDGYFYRLKSQLENAVSQPGRKRQGAVVIAHSMGNSIFRYFLAWLYFEVGRNHWQGWIDSHISAFFAVGAPILGASEPVEVFVSGVRNGLPLTNKEVRDIQMTYASNLMLLPHWHSEASDWLFSFQHVSEDGKSIEYTTFSAEDIAEGKMFEHMGKYEEASNTIFKMMERYSMQDQVLDMLSTWERPPIKHVYAIYGVGLPALLKYNYTYSNVTGTWDQLAVTKESSNGTDSAAARTGDNSVPYDSLSWAHTWLGPEGAHINITRIPQFTFTSAALVERTSASRVGGEHWAQYEYEDCIAAKKFGTRISLYRSCTDEQESSLLGDDIETWDRGIDGDQSGSGNFAQLKKKVLALISNRDAQEDDLPGGMFMTFYEREELVATSGELLRKTAVWEVDKADHRWILATQPFLREMKHELRSLFDRESTSQKNLRPPTIDEECSFDYKNFRCADLAYCEYRFRFGDITLDQSCRIKKADYGVDSSWDEELNQQEVESRLKGLLNHEKECACVSHCRQGYCKKAGACPDSHQTFGPTKGYWGPCIQGKAEIKGAEADLRQMEADVGHTEL